ncbi:MAG: HEAT repeat domain-containing protein [Deltaproteobacteria bacterium]|nr:HEAT repeat domain-containing protein [Deltaproteobacteria bacterium]
MTGLRASTLLLALALGFTLVPGGRGDEPGPRRGVEGPARGPRRTPAADPWSLPLPRRAPDHPTLPFTDPGSISVGTVVDGHLVRGREVPPAGPHHAVLAEHSPRGTRWGTDELVQALLQAAAHVAAEFPGARLGVGNVGRDGGGALPWSISHKAGRDADLAYYLVDEKGRDVLPDTLLVLAPPAGTVEWQGQTLRFDPARNYLLVEALLRSPGPGVQYIFCADHLVRLLREEARRRGAPREVRRALETFVRQPRGTLPHDDHFHVRVRCAPEDLLEGCRDIVEGREVVPDDAPRRERIRRLRTLLTGREAATRAAAAQALGLLRDRGAIPGLEARLEDPDPRVRGAALETLAVLWSRVPVARVAALAGASGDPAVVARCLGLLRGTGAKGAAAIGKLLEDPRVLPDPRLFPSGTLVVRREAARVAGWLATESLVAPLVTLAGDPDGGVRTAADHALRRITNHEVRDPSGREFTDPGALPAAWKAWLKGTGKGRDRWLRRGFEAAGVRIRTRSRAAARDLLDLIVSGEPHLAFNAQRVLHDWCPGRGPAVGLQDRWWIRRKWKAGVSRCFP